MRPRSSPFVGGSSRPYPELSGGRIIALGQLRSLRALSAYFSDRGRPNQPDRGRCFSVIVDGLGRHASPRLNVAQSSTISLKRPVAAAVSGLVFGFD